MFSKTHSLTKTPKKIEPTYSHLQQRNKSMKTPLKIILLTLISLITFTSSRNCANNCYQCESLLGVCKRCQESYYWDPSLIMCRFLTNKKPGCKYQRTVTTCQECNTGFVLNQNSCLQCQIQNCADCSQGTQFCQKCIPGYTSSSSTLINCNLKCTVNNCDTCANGSAGSCTKCLDGYRLASSSSCERCTDVNCLDCSRSSNACTVQAPQKTCKIGYFWDGAKCVICGNNCAECDYRGVCLGCDTVRNYHMQVDSRCHINTSGNLEKVVWVGILILVLGVEFI